MNWRWAQRAVLFLLLAATIFVPGTARAQSAGGACTGTQVATIQATGINLYCYSSAWSYPAYQFGSANGASCSSTLIGKMQWTGTVMQYCDGSNWDTITAGTNQPNAFSFTNQTGVSTSTTISSNAVTLSGFTGTISATCGTNCTAIARNGVWGSTTVSGFSSGDTIAIRLTSSASLNTAVNATVTAGTTTSGTWSVTTTSSTPSAFNFTDQTGVAVGPFTVYSNAVTLSGFTGTLTAVCNTGCTGIALNGVWGGTTVSGFTSGSTISISQLASGSASTPTTASVTVGNTTSSTWTVTTGADSCPLAVANGPGYVCPDGTVYAGITPDTNVKMYTTPCDAGKYWNGSSCTACASGLWSGSGTTCSTTYASGNYPSWNNGTTTYFTTGYTSLITGKANTLGLSGLSSTDSPYKAASYCENLSAYGYAAGLWYLPALNELNLMYTNKTAIGNFDTTDGSTSVGGAFPGLYWSSSETGSIGITSAAKFTDGSLANTGKSVLMSVRCVRR